MTAHGGGLRKLPSVITLGLIEAPLDREDSELLPNELPSVITLGLIEAETIHVRTGSPSKLPSVITLGLIEATHVGYLLGEPVDHYRA